MAPAKFMREQGLTVWFSVPSVILFMQKMRLLKPNAFPDLRLSLFCGEPLPGAAAKAWQEAAPNSIVENLYGPTEATIAISHYRWDPAMSESHCVNGVVPIGDVFSGQSGRVVDADGGGVSPGVTGELCLSGSQVAQGYWNDSERTSQQFVRLPGTGDSLWYRTGDSVREMPTGGFAYLGRLDDQVQIRGYRVELQEIDHALRRASGSELAVAVAWPIQQGRADAVYGFLGSECAIKETEIMNACKLLLPDYMIPQRLIFVPNMPLNANGKIDRGALARSLGERQHD